MRHWCEQYMSIPFQDGGRDSSGLDCWGWVRLAYEKEKGIRLESFTEVSTRDLIRIKQVMEERVLLPPWIILGSEHDDEICAFDVVVMSGTLQIRDGKPYRAPVHVGLMVDSVNMVHTERSVGMCRQRLDDPLVKPRILKICRHEALAK